MAKYRIERLNAQLQREIADLILRGHVKDPRVSQFVSINRVEVTKDLSFAKVYVSSFLNDSQVEKAVEGLNNAKGFIQSTIAKKMRLRLFPKLTFIADKSVHEGFKMVETLNALEQQSKDTAAHQKETTSASDQL